MERYFFYIASVLFLVATTGCAMCDSSLDGHYGAYGGKWQRTEPNRGRVASLLDPAGVGPAEAQAVPSPESAESENGDRSVLKPDPDDAADRAPQLDTLPDITAEEEMVEQPSGESVEDPPATPSKTKTVRPDSKKTAPKAEPDSDATLDVPPMSDLPPVEVPDFLKDLDVDTPPSTRSADEDDGLPPVDISNDLPPVRTDSDR